MRFASDGITPALPDNDQTVALAPAAVAGALGLSRAATMLNTMTKTPAKAPTLDSYNEDATLRGCEPAIGEPSPKAGVTSPAYFGLPGVSGALFSN